MKHMMKLILALALSALLVLSMLALAENEATEVEALGEEIAAENVDAAPGEANVAVGAHDDQKPAQQQEGEIGLLDKQTKVELCKQSRHGHTSL